MSCTSEQLKEAVANSKSYSGVLRYLSKSISGESHKRIKTRIEKEKIDISHFEPSEKRGGFASKLPYSKILVYSPDKTYRIDGARLTKALIESGRIYCCEKCENNGKWLDQNLTLEVHHKDSNWRNNQKENLQFLCPNCHSQTDNFYHRKQDNNKCLDCEKQIDNSFVRCTICNRKQPRHNQRKVKNRPPKDVLVKELESSNYCAMGRKYGVSDNAIRKWIGA